MIPNLISKLPKEQQEKARELFLQLQDSSVEEIVCLLFCTNPRAAEVLLIWCNEEEKEANNKS